MPLFSRINKPVLRAFVRAEGWSLLVALFPAAIYSYTDSLWVGIKVFLVIALVTTLGLLWAFWGALFPYDGGSS